jgi:hypothetical protein
LDGVGGGRVAFKMASGLFQFFDLGPSSIPSDVAAPLGGALTEAGLTEFGRPALGVD